MYYYQPQRKSAPSRRPSETMCGAVMWTLAWFLVMVLLALAGVGTWRFIDQAKEYGEKRTSIRDLDEEILELVDRIEQMAIDIPTSCVVNIDNLTQPLEYSDEEFQIFSFADSSSGILFDVLVPGVPNVVLTVQNTSGIVAYLSDLPLSISTFFDDEFAVFNAGDNTRIAMLDLAGLSSPSTRILTIQDASGTIAYLSDIPPLATTFADDEFAILNVLDNSKEVMLYCGGIGASTTQTMTIQDASGTIAYLADIANLTGVPFPDDEFYVHADGDITTRVMFDLGAISTGTNVVMTVQDRSGVIAYLSDLVQVVEVLVTESRQFPNVTIEGVGTLSELGDIKLLEISMCGGGGTGGENTDTGPGAGGGSGAGFEDFRVLNANDRFEYLDVSLGLGGHYAGTGAPESVGGTTTVTGFSITGFFLELIGYGGGGGKGDGNTSVVKLPGGGGGSGGPGGTSGESTAGPAEKPLGALGVTIDMGGVAGGAPHIYDMFADPVINTPPGVGLYRLPWRSGSGGSRQTDSSIEEISGAAAQGGYSAASSDDFGFRLLRGGSSRFGPGGTFLAPAFTTDAGYCAGGGETIFIGGGVPGYYPSGDGGPGVALMRYYIK